MYIFAHSGPVIIRSSGGDIENGSIINDFVVNGTDTKLSLTCTSVYQNEIVEWIMLNIFGNVEQELSSNSYSSTITFTHPTDDFNSTFRCKSNNTLLYKDVFITKRKYMHTRYVGNNLMCISMHISSINFVLVIFIAYISNVYKTPLIKASNIQCHSKSETAD